MPTTFEEVTDNPLWADEIPRVYRNIERVDLMVGLYAEPLPKGFAFSDTAFRIFVLMASRRLNSDRFFGRDYGPHVYTQAGIDWIDDNQMRDVCCGTSLACPGAAGPGQRLRTAEAGGGHAMTVIEATASSRAEGSRGWRSPARCSSSPRTSACR